MSDASKGAASSPPAAGRAAGRAGGKAAAAGAADEPGLHGALTAGEIERAVAQGMHSSKKRMKARSDGMYGANKFHLQLMNLGAVLDARRGSVLDARSILKTDYVPSSNKVSEELFPIQINGTFNLRQSETTGIFGVAQPTISGIRGLLNLLGCGPTSRHREAGVMRKSVLWINLREEPTLYVNGRSTVLRERSEPFHNIDQLQGIEPARIRELEVRLKEDVVDEAAKYQGNIVLHEENRKRELQANWEAVALDDIKSPDEVFFTLNMQAYRVRYVRIPTTPERAPSTHFFDMLVDCLMQTPPHTSIVFNCQTGVSRSTIGMVAAGLVQMWRGIIDIPPDGGLKMMTSVAEDEETDEDSHEASPSISARTGAALAVDPVARRDAKVTRVLSGVALSSLERGLSMETPRMQPFSSEGTSNDAVSKQLEAGWYQPTLNLIRLIDNGREAKRHVDFFSEDASHLVHLRSVTFRHRSRASRERYQPSEIFKMQRAAISLLRYLMLVTFDAYLAAQVDSALLEQELGQSPLNAGSATCSAFPDTFHEWVQARPEIIYLFRSVEQEPMTALAALDLPSSISLDDSQSPTLRKDMRDAMDARRGSMLNTDTILKADHFPGGFGPVASPGADAAGIQIRGAPNFRKVPGSTVYGVCTPTADAAASIIRYIQTASSAQRVFWTNLREEPLVYINKQPFVLRNIKQPFRNVNEFVMINPERLEAAEKRLKEDILAEARRYNGRILVHSESDDRTLELLWEKVAEEDVLTPREMYEGLASAGLPVDYARVPLTPEQPPSPLDVDWLLNRVREAKAVPGAHLVFNCQLGRGRSSTAMAIALLELQRSDDPSTEFFEDLLTYGHKEGFKHTGESNDQLPRGEMMLANKHKRASMRMPKRNPSSGYSSGEEDAREDAEGYAMPRDGSVTPPAAFPADRGGEFSDDEDQYTSKPRSNAGPMGDEEFSIILSVVRVLSDGVKAKKWADLVIDQCGEVENIRSNIIDYVERAATARSTERAGDFIERGLLNMRRYVTLVLVAAFQITLAASKGKGKGSALTTFERWFTKRPELKTIINEIKGKAALRFASVDKVLSGPPPSEQNELAASDAPPDAVDSGGVSADTTTFVARRSGMVLTRGSILKSDHFPGCNRLRSAKVVIPGAPNFREIITSRDEASNIGMYGTGIPTVEGLRGILNHISKQRQGHKKVVWVNLREEPILYVNGRPFVLRKLEHPFENLEHTGISKDRVEDMEARLKVDVLNEIIANDGRFLLHDEDETGLKPVWQTVDISEGSTSVQTPRDLYKMLRQEFNVEEHRVPITDEQAPKVTDYDEISTIVRNAPTDSEIVFNCQMGRGRTTTGLVVAVAVRLWERRELFNFPTVMEQLVAENVIATKRKLGSAEGADDKYLAGSYEAIGALTRVLDQGAHAKSTIDSVIDTCDALQNLREAISSLRDVAEAPDKTPVRRAAAFNRGVQYLRRYYQLIEFADYLFTVSPDDRTRIMTFAAWLRDRRELRSILRGVTLA